LDKFAFLGSTIVYITIMQWLVVFNGS
jgi:hypothetical protein